jgi:hypothetical protein
MNFIELGSGWDASELKTVFALRNLDALGLSNGGADLMKKFKKVLMLLSTFSNKIIQLPTKYKSL